MKTIRRRERVRLSPNAAGQIEPTWTHERRTWTSDEYMQANNVSGVLVLKDGKVLLERYGLSRTPGQRWTSFSVAKPVTSTLARAAVQEGKLSLEAPVTR
ncbi:MAG TPA: serine hydrolase domain-containing protein [Phenylobacterium sp.]